MSDQQTQSPTTPHLLPLPSSVSLNLRRCQTLTSTSDFTAAMATDAKPLTASPTQEVSTPTDTGPHHNATFLCLRRSSFRLLLFSVAYVVYLCAGALCFQIIETPSEVAQKKELASRRLRFLEKYRDYVEEADLDELIRAVSQATSRGVTLNEESGNMPMAHSNWDFSQSLFFSATIVTTIGYGRTTPLSEWGKGFSIVFSLFGIPLTMVLFTAMVERIHRPYRHFRVHLVQRCFHRFDLFQIRLLHLGLAAAIVGLGFFLLPAWLLYLMEGDWTFLDALYYCVITLTTIGLGDFIPGEDAVGPARVAYKLGITVFLFVGLIAVFFLLEVFHDVPELNLGRYIYMDSDLSCNRPAPLDENQPLMTSTRAACGEVGNGINKKLSYASIYTSLMPSESSSRIGLSNISTDTSVYAELSPPSSTAKTKK